MLEHIHDLMVEQITNIITASFQRHNYCTKNIAGYEYTICKNIGRSTPQTAMEFLVRAAQPPPLSTTLVASIRILQWQNG
jgi:hypothetical protein